MKFGEVKNLNDGGAGFKLVPIRREDDKPLYVTGKCFGFYKGERLVLDLDRESVADLKNIVDQCETHLGKPMSKDVFYGKNSVESVESCDVKAVLEISGILVFSEYHHASLQVNVYDVLVRTHDPRTCPYGYYGILKKIAS